MRHTLPAGVVGPGFNDEFGDTFGIIYGFTADGFTQRELRDYVEDVRSQLLLVPDVSKIEMLGAQDERIFVEFSMRAAGQPRHRPLRADRRRCRRRTWSARPARSRPATRSCCCGSPAHSSPSRTCATSISSPNGRMIRLRDIAEVRRGFADPPQPLFRVNGKPAIGLAIAMREGGDILALGRNIDQAMHAITADLPLGIEPMLVADQPHVVEHAISEFTTSLWQAIAIIMAVSFVSLGVRAGLVVALSIPLTLAIVFPIMQFAGHRPAAHLARRADHRAGPAGR